MAIHQSQNERSICGAVRSFQMESIFNAMSNAISSPRIDLRTSLSGRPEADVIERTQPSTPCEYTMSSPPPIPLSSRPLCLSFILTLSTLPWPIFVDKIISISNSMRLMVPTHNEIDDWLKWRECRLLLKWFSFCPIELNDQVNCKTIAIVCAVCVSALSRARRTHSERREIKWEKNRREIDTKINRRYECITLSSWGQFIEQNCLKAVESPWANHALLRID